MSPCGCGSKSNHYETAGLSQILHHFESTVNGTPFFAFTGGLESFQAFLRWRVAFDPGPLTRRSGCGALRRVQSSPKRRARQRLSTSSPAKKRIHFTAVSSGLGALARQRRERAPRKVGRSGSQAQPEFLQGLDLFGLFAASMAGNPEYLQVCACIWGGGPIWVWFKTKLPGIGRQVLVHGSV